MTALLRLAGSCGGAVLMFAVWVAAVLLRMPKPPVPPSLALTLTAPLMTAAGFAIGLRAIERFTSPRAGTARGTFLWTLAGGELGALVMYSFGGMMAGFGIMGFGAAALAIREWRGRR